MVVFLLLHVFLEPCWHVPIDCWWAMILKKIVRNVEFPLIEKMRNGSKACCLDIWKYIKTYAMRMKNAMIKCTITAVHACKGQFSLSRSLSISQINQHNLDVDCWSLNQNEANGVTINTWFKLQMITSCKQRTTSRLTQQGARSKRNSISISWGFIFNYSALKENIL